MQVDSNTSKKGATKRRSSSICCTRKRRGMPCISVTIPYRQFESDFFTFVNEVRVDQLISPTTASTESALAARADMLAGKLEVIGKQLKNLLNIAESSKVVLTATVEHIHKREMERSQLQAELAVVTAQLAESREYSRSAASNVKCINEQIRALDGTAPDEQLRLRSALAERIAATVSSIELCTVGDDIQLNPETGEPLPRDTDPSFSVELKNGVVIDVAPRSRVKMAFDPAESSRLLTLSNVTKSGVLNTFRTLTVPINKKLDSAAPDDLAASPKIASGAEPG